MHNVKKDNMENPNVNGRISTNLANQSTCLQVYILENNPWITSIIEALGYN